MSYKKEPKEIYRNALAVYLNMAVDNLPKWLNLEEPERQYLEKILDNFGKNNNIEKMRSIWGAAQKNIYFIEWAVNNKRYFAPDPEEESMQDVVLKDNYAKLLGFVKMLVKIRNYWSHIKHSNSVIENELKKSNELKDFLLELYLRACGSTEVEIPQMYKGSEGLYVCDKDPKSEPEPFKVICITNEFSITGYVFYTCMFLDGQQINSFMEAMEQSNYKFDELEKRRMFRLTNPKEAYPDELTKKTKGFLYARDVYVNWRVRGHRDNVFEEHSLDDKEAYYSMLEYLKRCPKERMELLNGVPDLMKQYSVEDTLYDVREKNKFMEWGLEFWDNEIERLSAISPKSNPLATWKWGHHQSAYYKHKIKVELEKEAKEHGRPYRFPRYQKVVFDLPTTDEEKLNYRNDEHGFPYYLIKDDSNTFTKAMFHYEFMNGEKVIGLMGSRLLCSILEYYLWKYPVTDTSDVTESNRRKFWVELFKACYFYIKDFSVPEKEKNLVSQEKMEKRIDLLTERYKAITEDEKIRTHSKILFILDTWNQMLTFGQPTNLAHANDSDKGVIGGKNGYQELMRCLSKMDDLEENRNIAYEELCKKLQILGKDKTKTSYFYIINSSFQKYGVSKSPTELNKCQTIDSIFDLCKKYREAMLAKFRLLLIDFSIDTLRPAYEMRWLGLSDSRTHEASQQTKPTGSRTLETNIINVDKRQYSAVGLPRDIRQLPGLSKYIDAEDLQNIHAKIYPSPNNCTLLIPDFYTKNGVELSTLRGDQSVRKRLFLIRRQDTVLSHIAYQKGIKAEGRITEDMQLINSNFQETEMTLPINKEGITILSIRFYYRYYKQNRYQLPKKLTTDLCELLVSRNILQKGDVIKFNRMELVPKETLKRNELMSHLSKEEQLLPENEILKIIEERYAAIKTNVFKPSNICSLFYMDELLNSYTICRRAIIEKLFKLEQRVLTISNMKIEDTFIKFICISNWLFENMIIDESEKILLEKIRNAAMHCNIPSSEYLPIDIIDETKFKDTTVEKKQFLNIFGKGMEITNEILNRLDKTYPQKQQETNGKRCAKSRFSR